MESFVDAHPVLFGFVSLFLLFFMVSLGPPDSKYRAGLLKYKLDKADKIKQRRDSKVESATLAEEAANQKAKFAALAAENELLRKEFENEKLKRELQGK